jgi:hypothetical protein
MTSMAGGAGDKTGNRYEHLWTALRFADLIEGPQIASDSNHQVAAALVSNSRLILRALSGVSKQKMMPKIGPLIGFILKEFSPRRIIKSRSIEISN